MLLLRSLVNELLDNQMLDKRIHYQLIKSCGELHLYKVTLNLGEVLLFSP